MKILFIMPFFSYPIIRGDDLIFYHRIRTLSSRHDIRLLAFYQTLEQLRSLEKLRPYCQEIYTVKLPKWETIVNLVTGFLFSDLPLHVCKYRSLSFQKQIQEILKSQSFDIVHAFGLKLTPYLQDIPIPKVLEIMDSLQLNLERKIRISKESLLKRWLLIEEIQRIENYEKKIGKYCDCVIVVAEKDKSFIPSGRVEVIPNGIDINVFKTQIKSLEKPRIIFSGNMAYAPNIHAINWFVEICLPIIQKLIPEISLIIAGANPPKPILNLSKIKGITVTGFVDSMAEVLNQASVAIAPMQSGSGMQNKILEAMACELPIVTTSLGLGSIKARSEKEIFIADNPEEFAEKIIYLLENPQLANEIGQKARDFVIQNHSWESTANQIEDIYKQLISNEYND